MWTQRNKPGQRGFDLTVKEYEDIKHKYKIFSREYKKQEDRFYLAFIHKNELYSKQKSNPDKQLTPEEIDEIMKNVRISKKY